MTIERKTAQRRLGFGGNEKLVLPQKRYALAVKVGACERQPSGVSEHRCIEDARRTEACVAQWQLKCVEAGRSAPSLSTSA